jgi:hypothetical protein
VGLGLRRKEGIQQLAVGRGDRRFGGAGGGGIRRKGRERPCTQRGRQACVACGEGADGALGLVRGTSTGACVGGGRAGAWLVYTVALIVIRDLLLIVVPHKSHSSLPFT